MNYKNLYEKIEKIREKLNPPYMETKDKTKLYYREILLYPHFLKGEAGGLDNAPQKILLCIHGLGSHSGAYVELGERLKKFNVAVYAIDLRGHGLSQKKNEIFFYFSQMLNDVELMIKFLKDKYPDIPLYLLGESMGGMIVLNTALDNKNVDGLILLAAGIKQNIKLSFIQILQLLIIIPVSLVFKNLKLINLEANWDKANNDPRRLKEMKEDPLHLRRVSFAFLFSMAKSNFRIMKECPNLQIPVLILQGTGDNLVSWKGAEEFYKKLKSKDKEIKLFEGASHGLLADPKTEEVMKSIEGWIKK